MLTVHFTCFVLDAQRVAPQLKAELAPVAGTILDLGTSIR